MTAHSPRILVGTTYRARADADGGGVAPPAWFHGYSREFALLELAGTFHSMPSADIFAAWADAAPDGFQFAVQAFGLLCRRAADPAGLPPELAQALPPATARIRLSGLTSETQYEVWERFRLALEPLRRSRKLGSVIFRLPANVRPGLETGAYLESLCERLPEDRVVVEVAGPGWRATEADGPPAGLPWDRLPVAFVGDQPASAAWPPAVTALALRVLRASPPVPRRARDGASEADERALAAWLGDIERVTPHEALVHLIVPSDRRARLVARAVQRRPAATGPGESPRARAVRGHGAVETAASG